MTLSPNIKDMVASHTANMPSKERAIRASSLCRKYRIENIEDRQEVAKIAGIKIEELK